MSPEEAKEYERLMKGRPHVVILGAGATMAAIPHGDKNGRKSSVMNGFIDALGMSELLKGVSLKTRSSNLEDIYSELHDRAECEAVREELDRRIRTYFSELELPSQPNIYDLLLLGLRKKDLVATFNWDPLLLQAYQRAGQVTKDLPALAFLHGNVLVGYCRNHKWGGILTANCRECGEPFEPAPLLYPVAHKNYAADPYIQDSWNAVRNKLRFFRSLRGIAVRRAAVNGSLWGCRPKRPSKRCCNCPSRGSLRASTLMPRARRCTCASRAVRG